MTATESSKAGETSILLGYAAGVAVGWFVSMLLLSIAHDGITRSDIRLFVIFCLLGLPLFWFLCAVPFALVRQVAGPKAFATAARAAGAGAMVAVLTIPLATSVGAIFDVEGPRPAFVRLFVAGLRYAPLVAIAGAAGGLVDRLVEFPHAWRRRGGGERR